MTGFGIFSEHEEIIQAGVQQASVDQLVEQLAFVRELIGGGAMFVEIEGTKFLAGDLVRAMRRELKSRGLTAP